MDTHLDVGSEVDERQFHLVVRSLAEVLDLGADASRYRGTGVDFLQSRPYVDGDPEKSIDWRVSARRMRLYVKEYESLRGIPLQIIVDRSASMCVGSQKIVKYAWAVRLAGGFALAALTQLRPVGLVALGKQPLYYPVSRSAHTVRQWLYELRQNPTDDDVSLEESLHFAQQYLTARSLVIILSDFHCPSAIKQISSLAISHECIAIHLQDPAERGRLRAGFLRACEAETGRSFLMHSKSAWSHHDALQMEFARAAVDYVYLDIGRPVIPKLASFLQERQLRRR